MRTIEQTSAFKRDYKRVARSPDRGLLESDLRRIIAALAADEPLSLKQRDHALTGNWKNYRDCHLKPDLVLIYRVIGKDRLILVRLGSHSELEL